MNDGVTMADIPESQSTEQPDTKSAPVRNSSHAGRLVSWRV
jgi:hypothetical protein